MAKKSQPNQLHNEWIPHPPSRPNTLKFESWNINIVKHSALVQITFTDKDKKEVVKEIAGSTDRVYTTALTYLPQDKVLLFSRYFDEKRYQRWLDSPKELTNPLNDPQPYRFKKHEWQFKGGRAKPIKTKTKKISEAVSKAINDKFYHGRITPLKFKQGEGAKWIVEEDLKKIDVHISETLSEEKKIQKKDLGIYGYKTPGEMLADRIAQSGISTPELAKAQAFADTSMIQKHIKGEREITRDQAIIYSRVFGCDPSDILFPSPQIPIWGSTDFLRFHEHTFEAHDPKTVTLPWSPGEIYPDAKLPLVLVPKDIYRPDVKACLIRSKGSSLDENVVFYYSANNVQQDCLNRLSIIGVAETSLDASAETRYYIGIYESYRGKTRLINPDPFGKEHLDSDKHNPRNNPVTKGDNQFIVNETEDIKFATPIVAMIHPEKIKQDKYSAELFKRNTEIYNNTRQQEHARILGAQLRAKEVEAAKENTVKITAKLKKQIDFLNRDIRDLKNRIELVQTQSWHKALIGQDMKITSSAAGEMVKNVIKLRKA